ncbi:MAG: MOSC N-terminal beta barrel domain-containing protein [Mycobacterium sp.]|nr:MOSC N-terminal beta barrel domain-containing protein [Mycobacterium sp.]
MVIAAMGTVSALWRYPVKSLGGETIQRADFNSRGVHGDRLWAVRDVERDITASARRIPKLLTATARYCAPVPRTAGPGDVPDIEITFPDGAVLCSKDSNVDTKLSELVNREVRLTALPPADDTSLHRLSRTQRSENLAAVRSDFGVADDEKLPDTSIVPIADMLTLSRYSTPPGTFVDLAPVHVLTETSLQTISAEVGHDVDVRRFRPNVMVHLHEPETDLPEAVWIGHQLQVGAAVLAVRMPTLRCVVPSRPQPGLEVDRAIPRALTARAQFRLGVYAGIAETGAATVGDAVNLRMRDIGRARQLLGDAARKSKRIVLGAATRMADRMNR